MDHRRLRLDGGRVEMPTIRGLSQGGVQPHASTHMSGGSDAIQLDQLAAPTDITTLNVSSSAHGLAPKSPADATQFLNGAATPAFAAVKDSDLSTTDITTNNVSSSKHGFAPKNPNDATKYLDGTGAYSIPAGTGGAGRYLGSTILTSGTSFTTGASTNKIRVRVVGGGGGGGGANNAAASGGAAGGYAEKTFSVSPSTAYSYAIGAAGSGGSAGANNGTAGGNTTFTVSGTTVTANGGPAGLGAGASGVFLGGAAPAVSTSGDVNGSGEPGGWSFNDGTQSVSGSGGSSIFGGGGNARKTDGAGNAGVGHGSGGAGAWSPTTKAGGAGTAGMIIVEEYS
jgi:hypothetical protein